MFRKGRYLAREAGTEDDIRAAQRLRHLAFHGSEDGCDADRFDELCTHILVEEQATGRLVCCFRMLPLSNGGEIERSYSAQFYGLSSAGCLQGADG